MTRRFRDLNDAMGFLFTCLIYFKKYFGSCVSPNIYMHMYMFTVILITNDQNNTCACQKMFTQDIKIRHQVCMKIQSINILQQTFCRKVTYIQCKYHKSILTFSSSFQLKNQKLNTFQNILLSKHRHFCACPKVGLTLNKNFRVK